MAKVVSCGTAACEALAGNDLLGVEGRLNTTDFIIEKLDCPSEERQIRQALGRLAGVEELRFDLPGRRLTVAHRLSDIGPVLSVLREIGLPAQHQTAPRTDLFHVPKMDCKHEVAQIRERLAQLDGIEDLQFHLATRNVTVTHALQDASAITRALADIGMPPTAADVQDENPSVTRFHVLKMDCASEERQIRERLGEMPEVSDLDFDLSKRTLAVRHRPGTEAAIEHALAELGMPGARLRKDTFHIEKMDCRNEEALIRERLSTLQQVAELDFDLQQRDLRVTHSFTTAEPLAIVLEEIGFPPARPPAASKEPDGPPARAEFLVPTMDCVNEEKQVRDRLRSMPGIESLSFDLPARKLTVAHRLDNDEPIAHAMAEIGMPAQRLGTEGVATLPLPSSAQASAQRTDTFQIEKMDCPTEEALIRKRIGQMPGVAQLDFNLMQRKLTVKHAIGSREPIAKALTDIGLPPSEPRAAPGSAQRSVFQIENMDCPTEEALIRQKLGSLANVRNLEFNLMQRKLTVEHAGAPADVQEALHSIGMKAVLEAGPAMEDEAPRPSVSRRQWLMMGIAGASATVAEVIAFSTGNDRAWPVIALALVSIATGGWPTYKKGWLALKSRILNMNALMSIAVTGAMVIGQWPEAAMVMFLFALAELIEVLSLDRARNAIRGLLAMAPETATVQQANGEWGEVPAKSVAIGAKVRIRPGERIPLDGTVESGHSAVNQAPITGESIPVAKAAGDIVFAGTINETGSFIYSVTAEATHSTLARIIKAVEEAQGSRAPTQRFVDQFARIYTPAVFLFALAVALFPPLVMGGAWMDSIYKALVLLVIACPCALVISTPVTVVSGLAAAARRGILIKGGAFLEQGRKLKALALDKTGTITEGKPAVTDVVSLAGAGIDALRLASSLAARSDHPVSGAVARHWSEAHAQQPLMEVEAFEAVTGRGVKGRVEGQWIYLGNYRLLQELGISNPEAEDALRRFESEGKTAIALASASAPLAVLAVADTVRETSRQAVAELHELGVRTVMLTGDNQQTASVIARNVGIDDARGGLLPEDKLQAVEKELATHGTVGMVGDGINDAPALAKSSIGFAMGAAGTDTAIETADVALMDDDLRKIPQFIRLSRSTGAILTQNIVVALGIKAVFFVLALAGMASLWMAVFADMGASLLVVFNGLRLLRKTG